MNNDVAVVTGADVWTPKNVDLGGRLVVNPFVTTAIQHIVIIMVNMILLAKYIILSYVRPINICTSTNRNESSGRRCQCIILNTISPPSALRLCDEGTRRYGVKLQPGFNLCLRHVTCPKKNIFRSGSSDRYS